jgi:hypothetical protein
MFTKRNARGEQRFNDFKKIAPTAVFGELGLTFFGRWQLLGGTTFVMDLGKWEKAIQAVPADCMVWRDYFNLSHVPRVATIEASV